MTTNPKRTATAAIAVAVAVLVIDQLSKFWIKTHFYLGEDFEVLPFFHIRFIENNGMAFGMEFGSKLLLTAFRIVLVGFLIWYLRRLIRLGRAPMRYIVAVSLVAAGAFGNIIDCVFYGEIFNNPYPPEVASLVPFGHGYGTWFHGLVVDMLYFPLFSFQWPDWLPFVGGRTFSFFDPVFNIADSAITVGMALIIIFFSKYLGRYYYSEAVDADGNKIENAENKNADK
ncbi:MAG: lipoprotein signal peptidase [Muribaculaceae bacterium]|nr:lipoprotein signal peptidase [Muribaculaceae bacterium]